MRFFSIFLFSLFISFELFGQLELELELFASGFDSPVALENAGDDRMFIVEKEGRIRVRQADGTISTFLNIVGPVNSNGSERGLLGLAFHPDYQNNGHFFVNYTRSGGDTRISRFTVSADVNEADVNSELIILEIDQPLSNHNGGDVQFGPDGYLYIGMGDGGGAEDPDNYSQNTASLLGKMLRIDIDNVNMGQTYSIPSDNPFVNDTGVLDEIWAIGLRNPWRYSFDALNGDLWIADVGQYDWEEISYQPASSTGGENYGWRCYEGNHPFNTDGCGPASDYVEAVAEYSHGFGNCSVTGGYVYRGTQEPSLEGLYLFADYCSGNFWATENLNGSFETEQVLQTQQLGWSTFGVDANNEVYVANLDGNIYRVKDVCSGYIPTFTINGDLLTAPSGSNYQWYLDGQIIDGATNQTYNILETGNYSVELTNSQGCAGISEPVNVIYTSIGALEIIDEINYYPNPAETHLNLDIIIAENSTFFVDVLNALGQRTNTQTFRFNAGQNNVQIDLSELSPGFYTILLRSEKEQKSFSLIRK